MSESAPDSQTRARPARIARLLAGNLAVLLALILVAEGIGRVFTRGKQYSLFEAEGLHVSDRPFITEHKDFGFTLTPGYHNGPIRINGNGFRGDELPRDFDTRIKILAIGESTTFGWNVRDDETYPHYLQAYLNARGVRAYVVNAGIPSYTSIQTLKYLRHLLTTLKPHIVVWNQMWNDILFAPDRNWEPEILLHRKPSGWRVFLTKHSGLYRALALRSDSDDASADNDKALAYYEKNVQALVYACREQDVKVLLLYPPFRGLSDTDLVGPDSTAARFVQRFMEAPWRLYHAKLEEIALKNNVPIADHRLSGLHGRYVSWFRDSIHPNSEGNRMMAEDVGKALLYYGLLSIGGSEN